MAVRAAFAYHSQRYDTRRLRDEVQDKGMGWAAGAFGACSKRTACAPSSPAHSCRALPIPTRPCALRPTACSVSPRPRPRTGSGWATSRICLAKAGAGSTWPCGWTVARAKSWAGTCEDLVSETLRRALAVRKPAAGLIIYSDQGSQYTATRFKELVAKHSAQQSMSRRGNCYEKAHAESF